MLPLHKGVQNPPKDESPNAGLWFDKYVDIWQWDEKQVASSIKMPEGEAKRKFYEEVSKKVAGYAKELTQAYLARRDRLVYSLKGRVMSAATKWRFVSGLGASHPIETGFIWHTTLGVPYLPASSIKGMIRAWLTYWAADTSDNEQAQKRAMELFGDTGSTGMGRLIVFDAIPAGLPTLEVDIMNPHYTEYYSDARRKTPPADYNSPVPVNFLAIAPNQRFEFALAPTSRRCTPSDLDDGMRFLQEALSTIGCGAKTAVGYGVFGNFEHRTAAVFATQEAAEAKAKAEALKAELASLPLAQQRALQMRSLVDANTDSEHIRSLGLQMYNELDAFELDEQIIVACALKLGWEQIGAWNAKKIGDKQKVRIAKVKRILGEA
ncbi:MAG: type III-B CRISPR module RAMP protein Cmr6 [Bacteroidota bacterium]